MEDYFDWDYNPYSAKGRFFLSFNKNGTLLAVHNSDRDILSYEHPDYYWGVEDWINTCCTEGCEGAGWPISLSREEIIELSNRLNLFIITYK